MNEAKEEKIRSRLHNIYNTLKNKNKWFYIKLGVGVVAVCGGYKLYQTYIDPEFSITKSFPVICKVVVENKEIYVLESIHAFVFYNATNIQQPISSEELHEGQNGNSHAEVNQFQDATPQSSNAQIERDSQVPLMPQEVTPPQPDRPREKIDFKESVRHKDVGIVGADEVDVGDNDTASAAQANGDNKVDRDITFHKDVTFDKVGIIGAGRVKIAKPDNRESKK